MHVVVQEQPQRGEGEAGRHDQHRRSFQARPGPIAPWLPGGQAEQGEGDDVAEIGQAARVARAAGHLNPVEAVGQSEEQETAAEQAPYAVDPPPAKRQHTHHERRQEEVPDRVGELGRHRHVTSRRRGHNVVKHERRSERRQSGAGDDAVEPYPGRYPALPRDVRDPDDAGIAQGIKGQPQGVADRGDGCVREIADPERPEHVARCVQRQAQREQSPRPPMRLDPDRPERDDRRHEYVRRGGKPIPDRFHHLGASEAEDGVGRGHRQDHQQHREGDAEDARLASPQPRRLPQPREEIACHMHLSAIGSGGRSVQRRRGLSSNPSTLSLASAGRCSALPLWRCPDYRHI